MTFGKLFILNSIILYKSSCKPIITKYTLSNGGFMKRWSLSYDLCTDICRMYIYII